MRMRPRRLLLALATLSFVPALPVEAGLRASRAEEAPAASRARDLQDAKAFLAREDVAKALAAHGLSAEEVDHRLDRLSDEDLTTLAANADQIQAAGEVPKYIWILLAIFLAVSIIVLIA